MLGIYFDSIVTLHSIFGKCIHISLCSYSLFVITTVYAIIHFTDDGHLFSHVFADVNLTSMDIIIYLVPMCRDFSTVLTYVGYQFY